MKSSAFRSTACLFGRILEDCSSNSGEIWEGYALIGLAPTTGAVDALKEAGIDARTVASLLHSLPESGKHQLWIVDEASFLHTRDAHRILMRAREADARVVLIGDTNSRRSRSAGQLHAVEAGSPFRLLQDAFMETVELSQIQRQKRDDLRLAVEAASRGNAAEAVTRIAAMGNVFEFKKPEDRLRAIARDYVADPKGALVLAPSNRERQELNRLIREELAASGKLPEEAVRIECLRPRDVTKPGLRLAENYSPGDVVTFRNALKHPAIDAGTKARVVDVELRRNAVTVELPDGGRRAFDPKGLRGLDLYEPESRAFSAGDRVQFRKPVEIPGEKRIRNGALATVVSIGEEGRAELRIDSRRVVRVDLRESPFVDHGYAVTTHKAQGATCNRVILAANTEESKLLLTQK
jgi:ATP-dependent exoDNAse (exonuclease V) alpha subunit